MTYFGTEDTNEITRRYLDSIMIEERLIDWVVPDIHTEIFGERFETPIMTSAFSHLHKPNKNGETGMTAYSRAAKNVGALNWVGMETD